MQAKVLHTTICAFLPLLLMAACNAPAKPGARSFTDTISVSKQDAAIKKNTVSSMVFVGDVMMGTNFPDSSYITRDRGKSLFKDCKDIIKSADLAIANLEGTLYSGNEGELRQMTNPKTYYIFRTPGDHVRNLVDAGFDAVGMANNHSNDFGKTGRRLTLKTLREANIAVSGIKGMAEECVLERNGIKYGFLQFAAACTNTLNLNDTTEVAIYINRTRKRCDLLVVTFHGGAEGARYTHVNGETEYYVGEKRGNVREFARFCIDHGADIVVGHGPHVPRAMELYKGHLIAYSLGNFCTPFRMTVSGVCGLAPLLEVCVDTADGHFVSGKIHSFRQQKGAGPRTDSTNEAARLISSLTKSDFPNSGLLFNPDGSIMPVQK